ncbi:DEHA2G09086p [Debaryomyces hansenii CBS767]|uniref:DEHA2G09086p n=1 Tax=Debaryomyces hansenii (strain ATCC 36239 / CBS 767 / BCRC 21394 / JCM 1990 / NBRC 0083 / IGC 2968) TaxID=284592 RepID=Q6BIM9_DEBHA|nr:DEHA2G09086p [Debaryomyces hansenii CBS767]CAG90410.1 DEHA2G09086p [Debaryomyces hansenii CBS767]|eukprot:XP_461942.1 DEHA2G09086p [Debaryomyces hansenii CBS767]
MSYICSLSNYAYISISSLRGADTHRNNNQCNEIEAKNTRHKRSYGNGIETVVPNRSNYPVMEPARIFVRVGQRQGITVIEDTGPQEYEVGKESCGYMENTRVIWRLSVACI